MPSKKIRALTAELIDAAHALVLTALAAGWTEETSPALERAQEALLAITAQSETKTIKSRGKYTAQALQLAMILEKLAPNTREMLYATLRRAVYGTAADVDVTEVLHALAELMGKPDPSGD
jgi:hypothetical protein